MNLSFPLVTQHLLDEGLLKKDWSVVSFILAFLAFAAIAVAVLGVACDWLSVRIGVDAVAALREQLFARLQRLPIPFFEKTPAGTLLSRFSGDVVAVETAVTTVVPWFLLPALEVAYSVALMLWFNVGLALVGLLLFPLVLLVPRVFARRAFALSYEKRREEGRLLAAVQENLASQPVIKAFGLRAQARAAFRRRNDAWTGTAFRMHFSGALVEQAAYVGVCLVHVAVLGLGALALAFPKAVKALILLGAAYLMWLAWKSLKAGFAREGGLGHAEISARRSA